MRERIRARKASKLEWRAGEADTERGGGGEGKGGGGGGSGRDTAVPDDD